MQQTEHDRNLLFGVIALQSDLVDIRQFVDACTLWASRKSTPLADILVEMGALNDEDRQHVEYLLTRKLKKNRDDIHATLAGAGDDIKGVLAGLGDEEIRRSISLPAQTPLTTVASTRIVGRIEQERIRRKTLHSTGGIGHVWLAHDSIIDREVALKELRSDRSDAVNQDRFRREAKLTGRLEHPGIVPVYDFAESEDGTHCYYTMRFLRGSTLSEVIERYHAQRKANSTVPHTAELLHLLNCFVSICNTIAYAHSRRILHRDLKGENVVVGSFGEVVVLDWGLAKEIGEPDPELPATDFPAATIIGSQYEGPGPMDSAVHTMQGERLGTPAYMAPEQAAGRIDLVDERTDVYGLAAILYEILTGSPPFEGKGIVEVLHRVMEVAPQPPRTCNPEVPPELEAICLRGLAKERDQRHQSAAELAETVQSWIVDRADRKRSEQERERFFALSPDLLAVVNEAGRLQQWNPAWKHMTACDEDRLTNTVLLNFLSDVDAESTRNMLARVITTGQSETLENRLQRADGTSRWVSWSASRIADERLVYIVGRDVTERREQEQRFHGLIESAPDALVVIDDTAKIVFANGQAYRIFGYEPGELIGESIEVLVPERFREGHPAKVRQFLEHGKTRPMATGMELHGRRKNGSEFPAEVSLSPVPTDAGLLVCSAIRDVTDRRRSQRLCEALLESAPDAMVVATSSGTIRIVNSEALRLFGYSREELVGSPIEVLVPMAFRELHPQLFAQYVANPHVRQMGSGGTLHGRHADGSEFLIEVSLSPIMTDEGLLVSSAIRRK